jgi:hypothetical protein
MAAAAVCGNCVRWQHLCAERMDGTDVDSCWPWWLVLCGMTDLMDNVQKIVRLGSDTNGALLNSGCHKRMCTKYSMGCYNNLLKLRPYQNMCQKEWIHVHDPQISFKRGLQRRCFLEECARSCAWFFNKLILPLHMDWILQRGSTPSNHANKPLESWISMGICAKFWVHIILVEVK